MTFFSKILPGFKSTCLIVGILNVTFFLMMVSQGVMKGMAEFKIPENLLSSPYYSDAMFWVFLHMAMLGVLITLLGFGVESPNRQQWISAILVAVFGVYLFLDIRTSDNPFGTALYQGPRSLFPVFIDFLYILLFLRLVFSLRKRASY